MQITGIILAGGKSRRMGTDKAFLEVNGKSLLERSIKICQRFCSTILISSNNPNLKDFGYEVIPDKIRDCGPMGGVYSCLEKSKTDWNFVLSVDSVFVENEFVMHLISEIGKFDLIIPVHSKGKEPLISLFNKNCFNELEQSILSGNYKMYDFVDAVNSKFINSEGWLKKYPKLFYNINRPEDLEELD